MILKVQEGGFCLKGFSCIDKGGKPNPKSYLGNNKYNVICKKSLYCNKNQHEVTLGDIVCLVRNSYEREFSAEFLICAADFDATVRNLKLEPYSQINNHFFIFSLSTSLVSIFSIKAKS